MAEIDTSPAALRALAEHRRVYQDRDNTTPVSRPWLKEVRAILRIIARNIEREMHILGNPSSVHINMLRGAIAKPTIDQIVHLYGREALLAALAAEKEAGAPAPAQGPLTEVGETSRGHKLYRAPNPVGGNTYWSDEIGGGVVVWDTCLVGKETLQLALAVEDADGWIPWEGGRCPVPDGTLVDVKLGDDVVDGPAAAEEWDWFHRVAGQGGDIIAYRLSREG